MTVAIIPARGGSKRLPNKNIIDLCDIPLIIHSINFGKENLDVIDSIIVSTDDLEIKKLALESGVEVMDRPIELSSDLSPTVDTLKHVIDNLKGEFENLVLLQPSNPLRPKSLLKEAYKKYCDGNYDSLMTVSRNHHKLGKIVNNKFRPFNYSMGQRSQDLEPLYYENGLLYISKTSLVKEKKLLGLNNFPFIVNHPYANVDIDTQEDLDYAHFVVEKYKNE